MGFFVVLFNISMSLVRRTTGHCLSQRMAVGLASGNDPTSPDEGREVSEADKVPRLGQGIRNGRRRGKAKEEKGKREKAIWKGNTVQLTIRACTRKCALRMESLKMLHL